MDSSMKLGIRSADDLHLLPYAVRVSRLARSLVRFNITLALGLKLLLAAGAVGGVVTLMVAVLVGDISIDCGDAQRDADCADEGAIGR